MWCGPSPKKKRQCGRTDAGLEKERKRDMGRVERAVPVVGHTIFFIIVDQDIEKRSCLHMGLPLI